MQALLKSTLTSMILYVFASLLIFHFNPRVCLADISVDSYCQLTIAEMQQQISDYQELINLANQYKNDPTTLAEQEEIKRAQFDQEKEERYSSYGITALEFVLYMGKNTATVDAYLEANPDVKQQMDDLKAQLITLAEEHTALKEAINQPPAPPSP